MRRFLITTRAVWGAELPEMPRRSTRFAARMVVWLSAPLASIEHRERLAELPEPVIFAFNQNNSLESILVPALLLFHRRGRIVRFLVDWMYIHIPVVGWFIRQIEPIPVYTKPDRYRLFERYRHRQRQLASPVEGAVAGLAAGWSLGIFPEGTRNRSATHLARPRPGLGRIVLATQVPVVPVGIFYPAKDRLGRMPRLGRFVVRIGEPLAFEAERASDPSSLDGARAVVDQVMKSLALLSEKSYSFNRSIDNPDPDGRKP